MSLPYLRSGWYKIINGVHMIIIRSFLLVTCGGSRADVYLCSLGWWACPVWEVADQDWGPAREGLIIHLRKKSWKYLQNSTCMSSQENNRILRGRGMRKYATTKMEKVYFSYIFTVISSLLKLEIELSFTLEILTNIIFCAKNFFRLLINFNKCCLFLKLISLSYLNFA